MNLSNIKHVYFLGIGGIGMSALARYFKHAGLEVAGYDKTPSTLTNELQKEGINIHFEDNIELIPQTFQLQTLNLKPETLIIHTPAVPANHSEYAFFNLKGFNIKKRAEVLGAIAQDFYTLAVAGTHGKTTTSSMVAHLLTVAGLEPTAFLGGITQNYNTNLLLGGQPTTNLKPETRNPKLFVAEADEYDRSFLTLFPNIAIITSLDADHLDIYGSKEEMLATYSKFSSQIKNLLIIKESYSNHISIKPKKYYTYSLNSTTANYYPKNIRIENGAYHYDIVTPEGIIENVSLGIPGLHNIENSVAATAAVSELNLPQEVIKKALSTFRGVKRRFDIHVKNERIIYIDDYAHHPEELRAIISSVKLFYPGKKVMGVFQPHLFSRTKDFADEFAQSLDLLDDCILLDIYPARELPIPGVDSHMLINKMKAKTKMVCSKENLLNEIKNHQPEVLLTLGAGDIDRFIEPIKKMLE